MSRRHFIAWLWAIVVCLIVGHNVYLWMAKRIVPDTDIMLLLPVQKRDAVLQQSFAHMVDAAQQRVVVLIGAKEWDDAKRAAATYQESLAHHPELFSATPPTDQLQQDWLATFQSHRLSLLSIEQENQLRGQPPQFWVDTALGNLYSPFAGPKLGAWRDDPFGLFAGWVQERAQETPVRPRDGYLFVEDTDRQYVLLTLTLAQSVFSMHVQQSVTEALNQANSMAHQAVPGVEIITAGVVLHAAAASEHARSEVATIGLGSLLGIILLTWATFRSLKPIVLVLLSISVGCLGSLSICWLLFERIHLLTLVFGASLIGVAQDYGIYFLCHRLGADVRLSSSALLKRLFPSLLLTLLAAVIGYMGLALTPFPGLRDMAVFSALGLIFAWLTVVCWFPMLIQGGTLKNGILVRLYGNTLQRWPRFQKNAITWVVVIGLILIIAFGATRLGINDDIRQLQNPPQQLIADQIKLSRLLDAPSPVQFYLVRGTTAESVLEREEALRESLDILVAQKKITGYQAISNWVPSAQLQHARQALVQEKLLGKDGALAQLSKRLDEKVDWPSEIQPEKLFTVDEFFQTPASEPWRHLWLGKINNEYASVVALRGVTNVNLPLLQNVGTGIEGVQWVDKVAEISGVLGQYRYYMGWVVLGSYVVIFTLLFVRYRTSTWRVLAPTAMASLLTLALLGLMHQPLQLFHVLALMLLLGIGVDYGIFMQEQGSSLSSPQEGEGSKHLTMAWLAIGLSAANTLLSFGLLGLSKTPALQAFGFTMAIGIGLVWLIVPLFRKE